MLWFNDKISHRQLQLLLIINIFGTGVILLPRQVAALALQDGWLLIPIATIFAIACVCIITALASQYPTKTFYEYTSIIASRPVAMVLSAGLILRLVLHIALTIRICLEILSQTMLPSTPIWLMALLLIATSGYGASKGYETRARLAEVLIFVVLVPILLVFAIAAFNVDYTNLLPVLQTSPADLMRGGFVTLHAFIGIELLLLVYPYMKKPATVQRSAIVSVGILGAIMSFVTVITMARFGVVSIQHHMWPVIQMMDATNLPGSFIQRQGMLMMSFFIISVFAIVNACLFFSSLILRSMVKKGNHGYYVLATMVVSFVAVMIPNNMMEVYRYMDIVFLTFGLGYMFVVPATLLIVAKMRNRDKDPVPTVTFPLPTPTSMLKNLTLVLLVVGMAFLVGCDKKELEEREYITALGIDTSTLYDGLTNYTVTVQTKPTKKGEDQAPEVLVSTALSIPSALSQLNLKGNRDIYLGITNTVVLGKDVLENPSTFRHTIDTLTRNSYLSQDAYLLASASTAEHIVRGLTDTNAPTSSKFHKNNSTTLNQLPQKTIETVANALYETQGAIIPTVEITEQDAIEIESLSVLTNYALAHTVDARAVDSYLLALGYGVGTTINVDYHGTPFAFTITKAGRRVQFGEQRNLVAVLSYDIAGIVEGAGLEVLNEGDTAQLERLVKEQLVAQVHGSYDELRGYDVDAFGIFEVLRKYEPYLYGKYDGGSEDVRLVVGMGVDVESIGNLL